jgi:P4 family phage/plasmid primase-like protien
VENLAASPAPAIEVTVYPSRSKVDEGVVNAFPSWPEFCQAIGELLAERRRSKKALPYLAPHVRKVGAVRRRDEDVERVTLAMLDVDAGFRGALERARGLGYAVLGYESPADGTKKNGVVQDRGRLIFLPTRAIAPAECARVRLALAERLDLAPGCGVDACLNPNVGFFIGAEGATPAREYVWQEGVPVDVDALLAATMHHTWTKSSARGGRTRADAGTPTGNVEPEGTPRVLELAEIVSERWLWGDREAGNFEKSFYGLLLGKGWRRGEVIALVDVLDVAEHDARKRSEHARKVRGPLETLTGPAAIVIEWFGEDWPRVDEIVNRLALRTLARLQSAPKASALASEQADEPERASDLGNARRFVRLHGEDLRYCTARRTWLVWDGGRWCDDETGEAARRAKASAESLWREVPAADDRKGAAQQALKAQSAHAIEAAIRLAQTERGVAVRVADFDADPWLLNVQNGVVDLRTGEVHAPERALLMTKCCAAEYRSGARSELFDRFIKRTFGDDAELTAYVQRALGYALFGAWREKAFWFGYGPADGAKSTFFGAIGRVLGDYAMTAAASTWMVQSSAGGNRGDLVRLLGARLVTTSEINEGMRVDEKLVKGVTGGDPIVAAAKYEGEIQFLPTFALWWFANDPPIIRDDDQAMWARARVVPFTQVVPRGEQIADLAEQLASHAHAPAVLAWLVEGCSAWQRQGIGTCEAVEQATRGYRENMNRLAGFVEEHLEITRDPSDVLRNCEVRSRYEIWCRDQNVRAPLAPKHFAARLRALGASGGDDNSKRDFCLSGRAVRERCWIGVRFRERG